MNDPTTHLDPRYSEEGTEPTPWEHGRKIMETAELYWLSTVDPDRQPHVTPLIGVWMDDAFCFTTGPEEHKAANLAAGSRCSVTTGCNRLGEGTDVVLQGEARRVTDRHTLARLAEAYVGKYGEDWRFQVTEDGFEHGEGTAHVFEVRPRSGFAFARGPYSQTRWRFTR